MAENSSNNKVANPYFGLRIPLTTKHQKLPLIGPAFEELVRCEIFEVNLDTDQLGTFSGEIERNSPPFETAVKKARLGMEESNSKIGIASEGSVGPDPIVPFLNSNIEHLVLVDDEREMVISESYRSFEITVATTEVLPGQDISKFITKADFPNHALIVRSKSDRTCNPIKGIADLNSLKKAIETISKASRSGTVIIESDLRAMHSPSRQKNITAAAKVLAKRVSQLCDKCSTPGWGRITFAKGLNCSYCGLVNENAIRQEILNCVKCDYSELGKLIALELDPAKCIFCNP